MHSISVKNETSEELVKQQGIKMKESLLSHIASNFISEYENVANSSISYLLNKYTTSREVLKNILELNDISSYFATELATKLNGRPDITGLDINGDKQVIIEGKFWAKLTDNQPVNYLKELSENGKLLFLVPQKRKISLKAEIKKRLSGNDERIYIFSWNEFLDLIEVENNKNYNQALISDITQLKELCYKMDNEGMPPLSQSDLDPMNGKITYQFIDLIDECNSVIRKWEESDFKGTRSTSFKGGHSFYFKAFGFGCQLCFSSYHWFTYENHTPIWLYIMDEEWKYQEKIDHYLNNFDTKNSFNDGCSMYGIQLKTGMDKGEIIINIVSKTREVLIELNKKQTINYALD